MKLTGSDKFSLNEAQLAATTLSKLRGELAALAANPDLLELERNRTETLGGIQSETGLLDLARAEIKRLESDIEVVRKRIQRDGTLLLTMANPKDIAGLEHELITLRERLDSLETQELEVLEQIDSLNQKLVALEAELAHCQGQISEFESRRASRAAELRREIQAQQQKLEAAIAALPQELSQLLQQLWSRGSGVGELRDTTCGVCHMGLNSSAINDIRRTPMDELAQCPECRAILLQAGGE